MTINEFRRMLEAIRDEEPFAVSFSLQYSPEGCLTLQEVVKKLPDLWEFMEKVAKAEPPTYGEGVD